MQHTVHNGVCHFASHGIQLAKLHTSAQGSKVGGPPQHTSAPFSNVQPEALAPPSPRHISLLSLSLFSFLQPCSPAQQQSTGTRASTRAHTARPSAGTDWYAGPLRHRPSFPFCHSPQRSPLPMRARVQKVPIMPLLHHSHIRLGPTLRPASLLQR